MSKTPYFVEVLPDGRWAFYVDHHLIDTFNTCEMKFKEKHIEMWRPRGGVNLATAIGQWWAHTMQNVYDDIAAKRLSKERVILHAASCWSELGMDVYKVNDPEGFEEFGGYEGGCLMASEYWPQAEQDSHQWSVIAVESGFGLKGEVLLGENDKVVVFYVGKPDKVILQNADQRLVPVDDKTVDRLSYDIQRKYKPHAQTAGYIFAVGHLAKVLGYDKVVDRCIINVAARKRPAEKPRSGKRAERFTRVYPNYSAEEIEEWRLGILAKCTRLRYCVENDEWIWREANCHLYSGCEFRGVHSVPPASRNIVLTSSFTKVEPWTPYKVDQSAEAPK